MPLAVGLLALCCAAHANDGPRINGFLIEEPLVPIDSIEMGGPPRDGIPAIDAPKFISAECADFLQADDRVLGISRGGVNKAYPIQILNRHEIVNDRVGTEAIVVTYCPLCGSGVAFVSRVADTALTFGVSGLLYNSDVLLYDRQTESLWSQLAAKAISGSLKGHQLVQLPLRHTSWQHWRELHPDTQVLSKDTGFDVIDYDQNPYAMYEFSDQLWFSVSHSDDRLLRKMWVLGITVGEHAKAYPFRILQQSQSPIEDEIAGAKVTIDFDSNHQTAQAYDHNGVALESIQLYWFAWAAFHPNTSVWKCDADTQYCY